MQSDTDSEAALTLAAAQLALQQADAAHAEARSKSDPAVRKKAYETVARKFLADGQIIYLYHPQVLVALSDKVDGYRQMPDGLVRVVGVKLK